MYFTNNLIVTTSTSKHALMKAKDTPKDKEELSMGVGPIPANLPLDLGPSLSLKVSLIKLFLNLGFFFSVVVEVPN